MSDVKNELETLLEQAAVEPAWRPAFFRALLDASVWVPGHVAESETITADDVVELQHWEKEDGTSVIPFFTSDSALQQAINHQQAFVIMPVRKLFEMTMGETLFLNAKLPTGKEFMPGEISHLLNNEVSPLNQMTVRDGDTSLLLSAVDEPPEQMIASLSTLFKNVGTVKRAFLCYVKEKQDDRPNLLIGIEAIGDVDTIIRQAGSVATDTLLADEPIDICQVQEGESGISHFIMAHITPFYERRWGSFLRDFKTRRII